MKQMVHGRPLACLVCPLFWFRKGSVTKIWNYLHHLVKYKCTPPNGESRLPPAIAIFTGGHLKYPSSAIKSQPLNAEQTPKAREAHKVPHRAFQHKPLTFLYLNDPYDLKNRTILIPDRWPWPEYRTCPIFGSSCSFIIPHSGLESTYLVSNNLSCSNLYINATNMSVFYFWRVVFWLDVFVFLKYDVFW